MKKAFIFYMIIGVLFLSCSRNDQSENVSVYFQSEKLQTQNLVIPDNPIIANALYSGFQNKWRFGTYTGEREFDDCQNYLIVFLSNMIGLTASGNIVHDIDSNVEKSQDFLTYRFFVQLTNDPDSEVMTFYIDNTNFHIHDQYGNLLNPDGWLWPMPALSQDEAHARLENSFAATWFSHRPDKDKMDGDVKIYGFAAYTWYDMESVVECEECGERHIGYLFVNSVTGEIGREEFLGW